MEHYTVSAIASKNEPGYWLAFARNNRNPLASCWTEVITTKQKAERAAVLFDALLNHGGPDLPNTPEGHIDENRL
jgi:hypothetical protein